MAEFGMQMPGGRKSRSATPNVYTVLLFVGTVLLAIAAGLVYRAGSIVGPEGNALGLQEPGQVKLATK